MMASRLIACVVLGFCAALTVRADEADIRSIAKKQANECQNALVKGEYEKFADFTHPKVVEENGGRKKMIETLKKGLEAYKNAGYILKSVTMQPASDTVSVGKEIYVVVPFTLEMTIPGGKVFSKGSMVGVSNDEGKNWVFADTAPGREKLKKLLPDLPDTLLIPKKELPKIVKD